MVLGVTRIGSRISGRPRSSTNRRTLITNSKDILNEKDGGGASVLELSKRKLTVIDLFCGCGGFSLGMLRAGYHVVAGIDFHADV